MKLKKLIPVFALVVLICGCTKENKPEPIADNSFFVSKKSFSEAEKGETYQCVQLRRGDVIELDGTVSEENAGSGRIISLTTRAGRTFILDEKDSITPITSLSGEKIHLKGKIEFEGNDEQLPVLSAIEFN